MLLYYWQEEGRRESLISVLLQVHLVIWPLLALAVGVSTKLLPLLAPALNGTVITPAATVTVPLPKYLPVNSSKEDFRGSSVPFGGMLERKHGLEELKRYNSAEQVAKELAAYPQADSFLPMKAPAVDMAVLLDSKHKQVLGIVDLRPWK